MKSVGIAILGFGTVGGGTYNILAERKERIKEEYGVDITVKAIYVSFDALLTKLSKLVFIPGAIAPPKNSPLSEIILKVVAVPKSTIMQGPPYSLKPA